MLAAQHCWGTLLCCAQHSVCSPLPGWPFQLQPWHFLSRQRGQGKRGGNLPFPFKCSGAEHTHLSLRPIGHVAILAARETRGMEYFTGLTCTRLKPLFRKGEQLLGDSPALSSTVTVYLRIFFPFLEKDENNVVTYFFS